MWLLRWIALAIIILLVLTFALQNQGETVQLNFLRWNSSPMPLYLAMFGAFVMGMIAFLLIAFVNQMQVISELRKERKIRKKSDAERESMKNELEQAKENLKTAQSRKLSLEDDISRLSRELQEAKNLARENKSEE